MAATDKDFKVKNGLVVQGSTATVNGNQVLTEASNLNDLNNVNVPTPNDGDSLVYDSDTQTWIPVAVSGGGGGGTASDSFKTIAVAGQDNVVADSSTDTLTFVAGSNVTITTNATNDSVTIAATDTNTVTNAFTNIEVAGQSTVSAETTSDTLTLVAGDNITITTNATNDSITIASSGGSAGASVTVSDTAPSTPSQGDLWYNSSVGKTYIYYDSFWVEANPAQIGPAGTFQVSATAPENPSEGNVWYNSEDSRFYVYYDNYWIEASSNEPGPDGRFNVSETAPTFPAQGDAWFNSSTGRFYIYYDGYWVENTSSLVGPPGVVSVTSPLTNTGTTQEAVLGIQSTAIVPSQSTHGGKLLTTNGTASSWSDTLAGPLAAQSFRPTSSTIPTNGMYLGAANQLNFATNSTNRLTISTTGALSADGTMSAGSFIPSSSTPPANGMYLGTANQLDFSTNSVNRLTINANGLSISRTDSTNEGGQIEFRRASDNGVGWQIDAFGSTSTPSLRFILNGTTESASFNGSGQLTATPAPGTSTNAATTVGYMGIPGTSNTTSNPFNLTAAEAGDHVYSPTTRTVNIPAGMPVGTTFVFISGSGATTTIGISGGETLRLAGAGTTGNRTLAQHGMATAVKVATSGTAADNIWYISGNGLT